MAASNHFFWVRTRGASTLTGNEADPLRLEQIFRSLVKVATNPLAVVKRQWPLFFMIFSC